jgi:AcrR family transcriptional regulator
MRAMEGIREQKKRLTQEALLNAALDLFLDQGYEQTTVPQIARAAGTSTRTFFRYFPTKEDVLFRDLDMFGDILEATLAGRPPDEPAFDALCSAIVATCDQAESTPAWREAATKRIRLARTTPSIRGRQLQEAARWAERLANGLAARDGRREPRLDELALANAGTALVHHAAREWQAAGGRGGVGQRVARAMGQLRARLAGPPD